MVIKKIYLENFRNYNNQEFILNNNIIFFMEIMLKAKQIF